MIDNLLAQAFEAIASSSGASKCKTGMKLPGLEKLQMKAKVDAKKYSALKQMHYGRMINKMKVKVKRLQKQVLDHPLLFAICHNGKLKLLSPWHFVTSGLCSIPSLSHYLVQRQ